MWPMGIPVVCGSSDVSTPSSPQEVGFYNTPGSARGVALSGADAFVADGVAGMIILHNDLITAIVEGKPEAPLQFELMQNYPNPFNPVTHIRFSLPNASEVRIKVYNTIGQEVAVLLDESKPAGTHVVDFDGSNLSSGVYFYKIQAGKFKEVKKMILTQ